MRFARANVLPAIASERKSYYADDASTIAAYVEQLRRELDAAASAAEQSVRDATAAAGRRHTAQWTATVAASANIDVSLLVRDDDLIEMLSYRVQEHVALIRSLSADMATRIERLALGSILEGRGNRETAKLLTEIEGIGRNRAKLIARDQASKLNGAMNQFRQEQAGITHYKWSTTLDGRERPTHNVRNGKTFAWAHPPSDGHPGRAINCFVGSTNVDLSNGCHKLWRRLYCGPLVTVKTSEGALLQATPNHPILTSRGWLAINDLQEGDHLIRFRQSSRVENGDDHLLEAEFGDLFEAASRSEVFATTRGSVFDFHSDGAECDVDTVLIDGDLPSRVCKSSGDDSIKKLGLSGSSVDLSRIDRCGGSALGGGGGECVARERSDLGVSSGGVCASLGSGHFAHADKVRRGPTSAGDVALVEYAGDDIASDAELRGNRLDALAGTVERDDGVGVDGVVSVGAPSTPVDGCVEVGPPSAERLAEAASVAAKEGRSLFECGSGIYEFDRVIEKAVSEFSGYVYNLESSTGWYAANRIVAHNCRCRALAIVIDDDEDVPRGEGEPEPEDIVEAETPLIRRVGNTLGEQVMSWGPDLIAARKADVREVRAILAALKGASEQVEGDLERMFEALYGFDAPADLKWGGLLAFSRSSQLRAAIKERVDIVSDLLDNASRF